MTDLEERVNVTIAYNEVAAREGSLVDYALALSYVP